MFILYLFLDASAIRIHLHLKKEIAKCFSKFILLGIACVHGFKNGVVGLIFSLCGYLRVKAVLSPCTSII